MNDTNLQQAIVTPQNVGEMSDADAVGTVGSPDCGDMVRLWIKYKEKDGQKIIDKASFQSFGCQTALAVAATATRMILGKTREEALNMKADEFSAPLGPLPPMKIHCGQMVEGALKAALEADAGQNKSPLPKVQSTVSGPIGPTLHDALAASDKKLGKIRIIPLGS